jgi:hypothetical protein
MVEPTFTSEDCRRHAQECLNIARAETNPAARARIEELALLWEHIGEDLRAYAAGNQTRLVPTDLINRPHD